MADTGWVLTGNCPAATGWANTQNTTADDGAFANITSNKSIGNLVPDTYGLSIPTGSTIDGIEVRTEALRSGADGTLESVNIGIGASTTGTAKTPGTSLATAFTIYDYGSSTDLWDLTPTVADINADSFRGIWGFDTGLNDSVHVDYFAVKVYYTPPVGSLPLPTHGTSRMQPLFRM